MRLAPGKVKYQGRGKMLGEEMLSRLEGRDEPGMMRRGIDAMFYSKNPTWKYENEYRVVLTQESGLRTLPASIVSVIYGMRFDESNAI